MAPYSDELDTSDLNRLERVTREVGDRFAKDGRCFDVPDVVGYEEGSDFAGEDIQEMIDHLVAGGVLRTCEDGGYEPTGAA